MEGNQNEKRAALSILLAGTMLAASIAGCSSSNSGSGSSSNSNVQPSQSQTDLKDKIGQYPIATPEEPLTLKIWSTMGDIIANDIKDFNDILAFQEMEKRTGVHIEWTHAVSGQDTESFNLMLASRDLPDLIRNNIGSAGKEAIKYVQEDVIIDFSPYLEYAPNFKKIVTEDADLYRQLSDDNGGIYIFPSLNKDPGTRAYRGFIIRQDWLDKVGMSMPTNTDELYEVLKAWQEKDVNGNGLKDEVFSGRGDTDFMIYNLLWCFGANYKFQLQDGKVTHGLLTDEFKEGMAYIAKLYSEGLIDQDYLTNDTSKWESKFISETAGAAYGIASRVDKFTKNVPGSTFLPVPILNGPGGRPAKTFDDTLTNIYKTQQTVCITTANKNIEKSMMWMDYIYSPEGEVLFNLGVEGVSYEVDSEGKPHYTEALTNDPQGRPQNQMQLLYAPGGSQWPVNVTMEAVMCQKTPIELNCFQTYAANIPDTSDVMPPFTLTEEEMASITSKKTDVETYVTEVLGSLAIGKVSIDEIDTVVIPRLKQLGVDDIIQVYQGAYERYMAKA